MEVNGTLVCRIGERSQVAEARRRVVQLARTLHFSETDAGKVALVVTEVAHNLIKYANGGKLLVGPIQVEGTWGIEILSLDRGPGMANALQCLQDGFSTAGTAGDGLGAVARCSTLLDIYSRPNQGSALVARLLPHDRAPVQHEATCRRPFVAGIAVAKPGQQECGDGWAKYESRDRTMIVVADGLGHGPQAAHATREAIRVFHEQTPQCPQRLLTIMHEALRRTRGAAVSIAEWNLRERVVRFAGIGNVRGALVSNAKVRSLVSNNGTAGFIVSRVQQFTYDFAPDDLLVMTTDGISNRWSLEQYVGLRRRHPSLIAGILYRDFSRQRDDATVVVLKNCS